MATSLSLTRLNMSSEKNSTLKIMAFNRPFELGMLYDFRTDKLIPKNISFWNSSLSTENVSCQPLSWNKCEIFITDKYTEKADLLEIDNNLKLSVLANLVQLSGSSKLIENRRETSDILRFILKYSIKKDLHALTMTSIDKNYKKYREILEQQIATHIVTDILYGGEIFFVFDRTLCTGENRMEIESSIKLLLKRFETFQIIDNATLNWKDHEKKLANTLKCQYYGDFPIEFSLKTFEEAVKIYKQLSMSVRQNKYDALPIQVWIYPLYLLDEFHLVTKNFHQINDEILIHSIQVFDDLYAVELSLFKLKYRVSLMQMFYRTEQLLSAHVTRISEIETEIRNQMKEILPKIRNGSMNATVLNNLLKALDWSSNKQLLDDWNKLTESKIDLFEMLLNEIKRQHNIHRVACPFAESQKRFKSKFLLCLVIHITEQNDSILNTIFQNYDGHEIRQSTIQSLKEDHWFNKDNFISIKHKVLLFIDFMQRNHSKLDIQFIAYEEYAEEFRTNRGVSYVLYENGVRSDFDIPSKPGKPYPTNISNHGFTLNWSKPINGSQSIQKYKIYHKKIYHDKWERLLTTTDDKIFIDILYLKSGKCQFKVQGITLLGDTAESDASDIIDLHLTTPIRITKNINEPAPVVTFNQITRDKVIVEIKPIWFQEIKPLPKEKIKFPESCNINSPKEVRKYECLSAYRSMIKNINSADFVAEPFLPSVENTETLVVILDKLADQFGGRLTFTDKSFTHNENAYRTACGITNLGSIHSFLASEGNAQTAEFNLHLGLDYDDVTRSDETIENFVLSIINDTSLMVGCDKNFIRVFSVQKASSLYAKIGITSHETNQTEKFATQFKQTLHTISKAKRPNIFKDSISEIVKKSASEIPHDSLPNIYEKLIPEKYDYKMKTIFTTLQLQKSDLDTRFNRNYTSSGIEIRGGFPYHFPQGWYRHALKVDDKYSDDKAWIGMNNGPGEWAVAYHGTTSTAVKGIKDDGLRHSFVKRDIMKDEAEQLNPLIPDVKGLYVATNCEGGASTYSPSFDVNDSKDEIKQYKVVFQCRVQPGKFTEHNIPGFTMGKGWRVFDEKAIRPYGLLLKTV